MLKDQLKQLVEAALQNKMQWFLDELKAILPVKAERYYKPSQIAARLNVDRKTVYRWIKAGKLKPVRLGTNTRIGESEIDRLISSNDFKLRQKRKK